MEMYTNVLLVTANVGSLFENVAEIQNEWLQELYKTIHNYQPQFVALHFPGGWRERLQGQHEPR